MSDHSTTDLAAQCTALAEAAGLVPLTDRTQIDMRGADRASFLHNLCTNDIKKLQPGQGCEAFLTNVQGKIVGHVNVLVGEQHLVLETAAGQAETLIAHLQRYVIREDVQLADCSWQWTQWLLCGKHAEALLQQLTGGELPAELWSHRAASWRGIPVTIAKVDWCRPVCFSIHVRREQAADVGDLLRSSGAIGCSPEALEIARMEAGFPIYGRDITDANLPQEVDRNQQAISFEKGCYLGQETVARIDALGHVNRTLCGLRISSRVPPVAGAPLRADDRVVGHVTSSACCPRRGSIGLGYVRRGHNRPATALACDAGPVEVVALPMENAR